ncbi:MAG: uroporphyrinogen-III C-methyltransferase [Burkholderiales bacterium]|jgi:uroporphyrin-III C-methyltransferase|nr:uroporphyrinogen-III C-methyltransferase [Burkholderiales bacterium]
MLARAQETTGAGHAEPACAPVSRKADAAIERVPGRRVVGRGPSGAPAGFVYLVGAGPGDADLLTLKAARLLAEADVCVYDHLVGAGVLALVRPGAEHVYVGKERSNHALPQEAINELIVALAKRGRRVVRLKGGDPFVFGRGGEEAQALAAAGVAFEVVPGVTAACGIAAATRIPLTHRDHAHSLVFVTGHLRDGTMDLDWPSLARPGQTVVVYMGLAGLPELARQLVAHGLPPSTPAAVVQDGTLPTQRVVRATLAALPQAVAAVGLKPPTLVIVGDVVSLAETLSAVAPSAEAATDYSLAAD